VATPLFMQEMMLLLLLDLQEHLTPVISYLFNYCAKSDVKNIVTVALIRYRDMLGLIIDTH